MSFMIDSQVLIYACADVDDLTETGRKDKQLTNWIVSSVDLVRREGVRISTVAWAEVLHGLRPEEAARFAKLAKMIRIESLDPDAGELAADLLNRHREQKGVCEKCRNEQSNSACSACGAKISKQHRFADALIVAHAHVEGARLYSCDRDVHALGKLVQLEVQFPTIGPLFGPATKL